MGIAPVGYLDAVSSGRRKGSAKTPAALPQKPKSASTGMKDRLFTQRNRRIQIQSANPKRLGSAAYARYQKYKSARTVAQFIQRGGCSGDLAFDKKHGWLKFVN